MIFHACFFSAALLLSAGLHEGSGNLLDRKVFFVRLAVDDHQAAEKELMSGREASIPHKIPVVKKENKTPGADKRDPWQSGKMLLKRKLRSYTKR